MPPSKVSKLMGTTRQYLQECHRIDWRVRGEERKIQEAIRDAWKNHSITVKPLNPEVDLADNTSAMCLIGPDEGLVPPRSKLPSPHDLAEKFLDGLKFDASDLQEFLLNVGVFQSYPNFQHVGMFASVMTNKLMPRCGVLELDLNNQAPVLVPKDFKVESVEGDLVGSITRNSRTLEYYRTRLLLSYLSSLHSTGELILRGNVGGFFAFGATGGEVTLEGSAGQFACASIKGARIVINGFADHDLLLDAWSGEVHVRDGFCCISQGYFAGVPEVPLKCFLDGRLVRFARHGQHPVYYF